MKVKMQKTYTQRWRALETDKASFQVLDRPGGGLVVKLVYPDFEEDDCWLDDVVTMLFEAASAVACATGLDLPRNPRTTIRRHLLHGTSTVPLVPRP